MEEDIKARIGKVKRLLAKFNYDELKLEPYYTNLVNNFISIKEEIKKVDSIREVNSIQNWLEEQYFEFDKKNLRFNKFPLLDFEDKYTVFYWALRELFEDNFGINISTENFEWQILDLAIIQLEYDLECSIREEIVIGWWEKYTECFSIDSDNWKDRINEFVKLFNVINKEQDWYFLEVKQKHFFWDYDDSPDEDVVYFIAKKTKENERISYKDAYLILQEKIVEQVFDKMKILGKLLKEKYDSASLRGLFAIDDESEKEFTKWFNLL